MEKYREVVKSKIAILLLFCVTLGAIPGVLAQFAEKTDYFGFIIGVAVGCELVVAFLIGYYSRALRNEEELKKLYIRAKDERLVFIQSKVGSAENTVLLFSLAAAVLVSGFFHEVVFFTLLGVLAFVIVIRFALALYYSRKI